MGLKAVALGPWQYNFNGGVTLPAPSAAGAALTITGAAAGAAIMTLIAGHATGGLIFFKDSGLGVAGWMGMGSDAITGLGGDDIGIAASSGHNVVIGQSGGGASGTTFGPNGNVTVAAPTSGTGLTASAPAGQLAIAAGQPVGLPAFTVATLPACNATLKGSMAYVTDASAPTYNTALTGGGAVIVPVFCNGTTWTSH